MSNPKDAVLGEFREKCNSIEDELENIPQEDYGLAIRSIFEKSQNLVPENAAIGVLQEHIDRMDVILDTINDPSEENIGRLNAIAGELGVDFDVGINNAPGNG